MVIGSKEDAACPAARPSSLASSVPAPVRTKRRRRGDARLAVALAAAAASSRAPCSGAPRPARPVPRADRVPRRVAEHWVGPADRRRHRRLGPAATSSTSPPSTKPVSPWAATDLTTLESAASVVGTVSVAGPGPTRRRRRRAAPRRATSSSSRPRPRARDVGGERRDRRSRTAPLAAGTPAVVVDPAGVDARLLPHRDGRPRRGRERPPRRRTRGSRRT